MVEEKTKLTVYLILLSPLFVIIGAVIVLSMEPTYEASYSSSRGIDSTLCSGLLIGLGIITIFPLIYGQVKRLEDWFTRREKHLILSSGFIVMLIGVILLFWTFTHGMSSVVHISPFGQLYSVCVVVFGYGLMIFGFIIPVKKTEDEDTLENGE
jgi:hypothetical protein